MNKLQILSRWIQEAKTITVLSGAGISTESGIPDFRSSKGIWTEDLSRQNILSLTYFHHHKEKFWKAFKEIFQIKLSGNYAPNDGHLFFADLEKQGKEVYIFTQNVDGLHQAAGSQKVYEVHGSIRKAYCTNCGEEYDLDYIRKYDIPKCQKTEVKYNVCNHFIPIPEHHNGFVECDICGTQYALQGIKEEEIRCKGKKSRLITCNHILKPDVVLFGEAIRYYQEAKQSAMNTELFMVVGSSLQVGPINQIPQFVPKYKRSVILNNEPTELDDCFELVIHRAIGETLRQVADLMKMNR